MGGGLSVDAATFPVMTVRDHMTLQYADIRGTWLEREGTIRHVFGEPPTHYYARLNQLLDSRDAEAAYPQLVHRLRRLREQRRAARKGNVHVCT